MAVGHLRNDSSAFWKTLRRRVEWLVLPPFLIAALLVGVVAYHDRQELTTLTARARIAEEAREIAWRLERSILEPVYLTRSLASLAELDIEAFEEGFTKIAVDLRSQNPAMLNIGLAPDLKISQVFPVRGNEAVLGLDLASRPDFMEGIQRAIETDEIVITGPVASLQGPTVFIIRAPIVLDRSGDKPRLWGIISVVFLASAVTEQLEGLSVLSPYFIAIREGAADGRAGRVIYGEPDRIGSDTVWESIAVPGGDWQLAITPNQAVLAQASRSTNPLLSIYPLSVALGALTIFLLARLWRQRSETESLINSAFNAIDQGFVVFDENDRLLLCNQAYVDYSPQTRDLIRTGISFSELVRAGLERGQYPDAVDNEAEWIANKFIRHAQPHSEAIQRLPDGTWLKVTERRTKDGMSVGLRMDITELVKAQRLAEEALQVKSEFISVLSHELRTPLTVILGYAKVLTHVRMMKQARALTEGDGSDREGLQLLLDSISQQGDKIQKSGEHLLVLINDLLDYSKIEAGHLDLKIGEVSVGSLIDDVVDSMTEMAAEKGLQLEPRGRDVLIEIDAIRAKQVLINLVGNAIKFTETGTITVSSEIYDDFVHIVVADTGCGIASTDLEAVFEAFQQIDFSDKRKAGGTGLGLAICRQIMLLHGGTLSVTSSVGVGSTFTAAFPRKPVPLTEERRRNVSRLSRAVLVPEEVG